jgi:flavin reductase (DIM6/NTAB) family NADH-FMN oxidoreductase RutF
MSSHQTVCELAAGVLAEHFKAAMGSVCAPVSVVTAFDGTRPHIVNSACWFACEVEQLVPGGDHTVVLARVVETNHEDLAAPLTYHRHAFGTHAALDPVAGRTT